MPIPDDERFEAYLKQFRPLVPKALPTARLRRRAGSKFVLWAGIAAAVAILVGTAVLHTHRERVPAAEATSSPASAGLVDGQPLTMQSANALMGEATSFKALIDDMAFRSQTIPLAEGKLSVVAVLGKEKTKL